jgi:ribosomal protein S18 acetylase RimI-like enzyme
MLGRVSELEIRPARDNEYDDVAELVVEAYAEYAARMSPDAWAAFAQLIGHVHGRAMEGQILVAERGGDIVGSVTLFRPPRGVPDGTYGVRLLSVRPQDRGTGIGRALREHCIQRARDEGQRRVVLTVTQEMIAARDLYEDLGFRRARELDHDPAPGVRFEGYALDLG